MGERYAGVRGAKGLDAQLAALGQSGYATDKDYATKLTAIAAQIPEGGFPQQSNSPYSLRAGHPPNPTVGTGGYTAPGANTTPVSPAGAIPATDKYGKAAEAVAKGLGAFGGSGSAGPALGAGGRAPLLPAAAPGPAPAQPIVSGGANDPNYQATMMALMQRLNTGRIWG